jgi:hypothetical protein
MRYFCSLLSYRKTVPCGWMKKLRRSTWCALSGLLTSLRLLVRGLLTATTRRTGEEEEGEGKGEKILREVSGTDK